MYSIHPCMYVDMYIRIICIVSHESSQPNQHNILHVCTGVYMYVDTVLFVENRPDSSQSFSRSVSGQSVSRSVGQSIGQSVSQSVSQSAASICVMIIYASSLRNRKILALKEDGVFELR